MEQVTKKDLEKTKLSKLKKGDKFYFPLDKDDEEIGRTNPLDAIKRCKNYKTFRIKKRR